MSLLLTEDSNDSKKHRHAILACYSPDPHLSLVFTYPAPPFPCVLSKGPGWISEVILYSCLLNLLTVSTNGIRRDGQAQSASL